jgi:hypothetical protein
VSSERAASLKDLALAGAAGGFVCWALLLFRGGLPFGEIAPIPPARWLWVSLPLSICLGAAAAVVAVFRLANTDTRKRNQCLAFALVCGAVWEPVLTGATRRLSREYTDPKAAAAVKEAKQVTSARSGTPVPAASAAAVAATLSKSVPGIQNPELRVQAGNSAEKIIDTLAEKAATEPEATKGLESVGVAAAEANSTELIAVTVQRLDKIAKDPNAPQSKEAEAAIQKIRSAAARK